MNEKEIILKLPYSEPFLFVDEIESVSENGIKGNYVFREEAEFYRGHFKNNPVTPGVILTECLAQIGLVCLGIYLLKNEFGTNKNFQPQIALSATKIDFYQAVFPKEKVTVISEKIYFRFNKLKCKIKMYNEQGKLVCEGEISGMIKTNKR